jgi:WD40 repeat protein
MPVVAPPKHPSPPRRDELEALIKEARRRQRKRQGLIATLVVAVLAAGVLAYAVRGRGVGSSASMPARSSAAAVLTTRFAVGAFSYRRPRWGGIVIADPVARTCGRVPLPHANGYVLFAGNRYVYNDSTRSNAIWLGKLGGGRPQRFEARGTAFWLDGKLAVISSGAAPRIIADGRELALHLPPGAQPDGLSASHGRVLLHAIWGNGRAGKLRGAIFVYANGVTKRIRVDPTPYGGVSGGSAAWSPDGSRIAFFEHGDVWTMAPDGSGARRLTRTTRAHKSGPLLWSADGGTIVYAADSHAMPEVYAVSAGGSKPATRLTQSTRLTPPYDQLGTVPLILLGNGAIAVAGGNSLGFLRPGRAVQRVCTLPTTTFSHATALR